MKPPDRVKRIMDSVPASVLRRTRASRANSGIQRISMDTGQRQKKLENPNKLNLKQFNRHLKAKTPSLTAFFPLHLPSPNIPRNP